MNPTPEQRRQYLEAWFKTLTTNKPSKILLMQAAEQLNNALTKNRQVVVIEKASELWSELGSELWSELGSELRSELGSELRSELGSELRSELRSELWSELGSELRSELRSELWSGYWIWEYYESIWPLFINEFYPQLKVLKKNKRKLEALKEFHMAGGGYILLSRRKLYVIPFPEVKVDNKRLHSVDGPALNFLGKETFWLYGVKFDESLWKDVTGKPSFKTIMGIVNMEQRMAALKHLGPERLLESTKAELIARSDRGNMLYKVDNVFSQTAFFLKYVCPSTGRVYASGIDPEVGKRGDPDLSMAWKLGLSVEQYDSLVVES